jgi:hypothetical protein
MSREPRRARGVKFAPRTPSPRALETRDAPTPSVSLRRVILHDGPYQRIK